MPKRIIAIAITILLVLESAGCTGSWRRKFVRKRQVEIRQEPVLQPTDYGKAFTNKQLYANHFAFWKNSESELISSIDTGKNQKRIKIYATCSLKEIEKLLSFLIAEKKKELMPYIDELKAIIERFNWPNYLSGHKNILLDQLRRHHRNVSRKFSYYSMKDYIIEESQLNEKGE